MESSATTDVNVAMPTKSAWGGWGKVSGPSSCPLSMVMSEELIEQIMVEENSTVFHDDTYVLFKYFERPFSKSVIYVIILCEINP